LFLHEANNLLSINKACRILINSIIADADSMITATDCTIADGGSIISGGDYRIRRLANKYG